MKSLGYPKLFGLALLTILIVFLIYYLIKQYKKTEPFVIQGGINTDVISRRRKRYEEMGKKMYNDYSDTQSWFNLNNILPLGKPGNDKLNAVFKTGTYEANGKKQDGTLMDIRFDIPNKYTNKPIDEYKPNIPRRVGMCEQLKSWNCDALNSRFREYCGICIKDGETSTGEKREYTGLYIDPRVKSFIREDALKANKKPQYVPTVGKCSAENFILSRPDCDYRKDRMECANATSLSEPNAAQKCLSCMNPSTGKPTFVFKGRRLNARNKYRLKAKTYKFDAKLRLIPSNRDIKISLVAINDGRNIPGNKLSSGEYEFIIRRTFENEHFKLNVEYTSFENAPDPNNRDVQDIMTSDKTIKKEDAEKMVCERDPSHTYNATGLNALFFGCTKKCCKRLKSSSKYAIAGFFEHINPEVAKRGRRQAFDVSIESINGDPIDISIGPPKYGSVKSSSLLTEAQKRPLSENMQKMYWIWDKDQSLSTAEMDIVIPVTFVEPDGEDVKICPSGPLISTTEAETRLRSGACDKIVNGQAQKPGTYSDDCIRSLFIKAGCSREGTGYPTTNALKNGLAYENGDPGKQALEVDKIIDKILTKKDAADMDFMEGMDLKKLEENNMYCYGKFEFNPCKGSNSETGPHSIECLDFLFRNAGKKVSVLGPTYSQSSNRSSGTDRNKRNPILYCNRKGEMAPINDDGKINFEAANKANSVGSVKNVMALYDDIHKKANFDLDKDVQDAAISDCYGITFKPTEGCGGDAVVASKIPSGMEFKLAPNLAPGAYIINLSGPIFVQGNVSSDTAINTVFVSQDVPDTKDSEIYILNKSGKPTNGYLVIDGFRATFKSGDMNSADFNNSAKWKVVDSIAGQPGEVSLIPSSKSGFYLFYNKIDRSVYINNDISSGKNAMSFKVSN